MAEYYKWRNFPGFVDPLYVVQYCVSLLSRDVYPNMEWAKFDVECTRGKPGEPCDGIKIYLQDLEPDPEICQEVRYYINHPCKDEMQRIICKSSKRALIFMLEYLKLRGSFIEWKVDDYIGSLNSISKRRSIIRYATSYLERLPELDYCACVCLGKYLHHLMSVAYAHEMFFMKTILSKLYGGIFIHLDVSAVMKSKLPEPKGIEYAVSIFENMLESCPWYQFSPTETLRRTIYPSAQREFTHKYVELGNYIRDTNALPAAYTSNLGEIMYQNRLKNPNESMTKQINKAEDECPHPSYRHVNFPPDKCNIDFGMSNCDPSKAKA